MTPFGKTGEVMSLGNATAALEHLATAPEETRIRLTPSDWPDPVRRPSNPTSAFSKRSSGKSVLESSH